MKTTVVFRKFIKTGEIIAVFTNLGYPDYTMKKEHKLSYMHVGQHGECNYEFIKSVTVISYYEEYKDLLEELKSIGYKF